MAIVDPEVLKRTQEGTTIVEVRDAGGNIVGYKGRFLKNQDGTAVVFDNRMEAHKMNQTAHRIQDLKSKGLNEYGQTKEQEEAFNKRKKLQQARRDKADIALLGVSQELRS